MGDRLGLREAQVAGATEQTVADYATTLLANAVALRALDSSDAAYDAAEKKGYFGEKDVAAMFDGRPLDAFVLDALGKAEAHRPSAAPKK